MRPLLACLLTFGLLLKVVPTADGEFRLYRDQQTCVLVFNGELAQVVDIDTCAGRVPTE
jgi:hypothetical protein